MKSLSLIILSGRDSAALMKCLESISNLQVLPDEIIVVFDMKHCQEAVRLPVFKGCNVRAIEYHGSGAQPHMRNIAVSASIADYLWFIDDDTYLDKYSCTNLRLLIESISKIDYIGAVAGRIVEPIEAKTLNKIKKVGKPVYLSPFRAAVGYFNWDYSEFKFEDRQTVKVGQDEIYPIVPFVQGTNMIFSRKALINVNGFNEDLGVGYSSYEDSEVCFALKKNRYKTIYCNQVSLEHLKLPRIGKTTRSIDFAFSKFLVRNFVISILKNNFPSKIRAPFYVIGYCTTHVLQLIYHVNGKSINKDSLSCVYNSFRTVLTGLLLGLLCTYRNKKRVGIVREF